MSDWQDVWTDTVADPPEVDVDLLRTRSDELSRTISRRNLLETGAAAFLVVTFTGLAFVVPDRTVMLANLLCAAGAGIVGGVMWAKGSLGPAEADPAEEPVVYLRHYRAELAHQIRLLRWVPVWYLGPLVPGLVLLVLATNPDLPTALPGLGGGLAVFAAIAALNAWGARQLQVRLDATPTPDDWSVD